MSRNKNPEDTTTDEEKEEKEDRYISIKLKGETWNNKALARQFKKWLRRNVEIRNQSYSQQFLLKFIEVAHLCSGFTYDEDQDRAFDEVFGFFSNSFPSDTFLRKFPEFNNQTLLQILTGLGLGYWFNRFLYNRSQRYSIYDPPRDVIAENKFMLSTKDNMGNTFEHILAKSINKNKNTGLYVFHQSFFEELWFKSLLPEYKAIWTNTENNYDMKPREIVEDSVVILLIQQELTNALQPKPSFPNFMPSSYRSRSGSSTLEADLEALQVLSNKSLTT
jgi:hypothetical protein